MILKWGDYLVGEVLSVITSAFMREAEGDVTHRREDMTTEAEVGVMCPQLRESVATRNRKKKDPPIETLEAP